MCNELNIDPKLLEEALQITDFSSKKAVVEAGLRILVNLKKEEQRRKEEVIDWNWDN